MTLRFGAAVFQDFYPTPVVSGSPSSSSTSIKNWTFAKPALTVNTYSAAAIAIPGWTLTGNARVGNGTHAYNNSLGTYLNAQALILQYVGGLGSAASQVFAAANGNYTLSVRMDSREAAMLQTCKVTVNSTLVATLSPTTQGDSHLVYTTPQFTVSTGQINLLLETGYSGGDASLSLTHVTLNRVLPVAPTVSNPSFEVDTVAGENTNSAFLGALTGWGVLAGHFVTSKGVSPWCPVAQVAGAQALTFVPLGGEICQVGQTISCSPGTYRVAFGSVGGTGTSPPPGIQVRVDGTNLGVVTPASSAAWGDSLSASFVVAGSSFALVFENAVGDNRAINIDSVSIVRDGAPVVTSASSVAQIASGQYLVYAATATGTPTPDFECLTDGFAIDPVTGVLTSVEPLIGPLSGTFSIRAANTSGFSEPKVVSYSVAAPLSSPVFTSPSTLSDVVFGARPRFTVTATGNPTPTFSTVAGGWTVNAVTGEVVGPVQQSIGAKTVVITSTNSQGTANQTVNFTVLTANVVLPNINPAAPLYYSNEDAYINLVRGATNADWSTDADGWVDIAPGATVSAYIKHNLSAEHGYMRPGNYKIISSANVEINVASSGSGIINRTVGTGVCTFTVAASGTGIYSSPEYSILVGIKNLGGSTIRPKDIVCYHMEDEADHQAGRTFRRKYLDGIKHTKTARFLSFCGGNSATVDRLDQLVTFATQRDTGGSETMNYQIPALYYLDMQAYFGISPELWITVPCFINPMAISSASNRITTLAKSPLVVVPHGYNNGDEILFDGGAYPTGITEGVKYFVVNKDANSFQVAATSGGAAITLSAGAQTDYPLTRVYKIQDPAPFYQAAAAQMRALAPSAIVHVEGPNETWNPAFSHLACMVSVGSWLATGARGNYAQGYGYYCLKAWKAWETAGYPRGQIRRVYAGQAVSTGALAAGLTYLDPGIITTGERVIDLCDKYAIAPYFDTEDTSGHTLTWAEKIAAGMGTMTDGQIMPYFVRGIDSLSVLIANAIGVLHGIRADIPVTSYECGQTILNFTEGGAPAVTLGQRLISFMRKDAIAATLHQYFLDVVFRANALLEFTHLTYSDIWASQSNLFFAWALQRAPDLPDSTAMAWFRTMGDVAAPVITSFGGNPTGSTSILENTTAVATLAATGGEGTWSLVGGADQSFFSLNPTTGALAFVSAPSFESPLDDGNNNTYIVAYRRTTAFGFDDQTLTVTVQDVAEGAPASITSNGGGATAAISINEGVALVLTPTASGTGPFTWSKSGLDADDFTVNPSSGALTFSPTSDFEGPQDADGNNIYQVTIAVQGAIGGLDAQSLTITVLDVPETVGPITAIYIVDPISGIIKCAQGIPKRIRVVDQLGLPVLGAELSASPGAIAIGSTGADGYVTWTNPPSGTFTLTAWYDNSL
jgi:hypothetical protein